MNFKIKTLALTLGLMVLVASGASAEILLCVSNKGLKGEQTVDSCLAKGEQFAVVDNYGFVRVLTPEEIALSRALNPKVFQNRAFGFKYQNLAPQLPPMPSLTREAP
jgi:hypothetical protein